MRNTIPFLLLFFYFFSSPHTQAQSAENKTTPFLTGINYKFGKIAKEELELTSYMPDSTAKAVYIIKQGETDYEYINELVLITSYYCRIKLLKDNAEDLANIEHIYYNSEHDNKNRDRITELKGGNKERQGIECCHQFLSYTSIKRVEC